MASYTPISIINYKGLEVLFVDYSHYHSPEDQLALRQRTAEILKAKALASTFVLLDVTGVPTSKKVMEAAKKIRDEVDNRINARAIIGIDPAKRVLLSLYNLPLKQNKIVPVNTREEGLTYLYKAAQRNKYFATNAAVLDDKVPTYFLK